MICTIRKISTQEELQQCLSIRFKVFVEGQNVSTEDEVDGNDPNSDHYLVLLDQVAIGTARVRYGSDFAKIERVAILDKFQGKGFGYKLMEFVILDIQKKQAIKKIKLSSQESAIIFYEKLKFHVCSEPYLDAGIWHKDMYKAL